MTAGLDRNREMIQQATELIGKKPEVYSLARLPPDLSFEETFQNMKTLLDEGSFGAYGASEMKRASLERAQKVSFRSSSFLVPSSSLQLLFHLSSPSSTHLPQSVLSPSQRSLTPRSSQSPTSKPKSLSGPMNPRSKKSSPGPRRTRSPSWPIRP